MTNPVVIESPVIARRLSKSVTGPEGAIDILRDLDLEVQGGEAVAVLGASGSGKSTLLGLLAGLDTPSSGEVSLFGAPLSGLDEDRRAALRAGRVGFVFQSFHLLHGMSAAQNTALPLQFTDRRFAANRVDEVLEAVGLTHRRNHYPRQLSGGEQQRVALARAFVTRPQLLFADEPTGNLDVETGRRVIDLLFELRAQHRTTLVLVTHDERLAERCDRRYVLREGRLDDPARA